LKYVDDAASRALLSKRGKDASDAREAMAKVPAQVGGVTLFASIILDPTSDQKAGSLKPLSWAFLRSITHVTNFLGDVGAPTEPGSHDVTADRFPDRRHQTAFHDAYREAFDYVPHGRTPKAAGLHDFIREADATHCAPLRLADFFAGTVRAWALAERRYDADPGSRTGKSTARPRFSLNRYMPHIRSGSYGGRRKSGYGLAIWPDSRRAQLDLWLARTRGERADEVYREQGAEVGRNEAGELVLRVTAGTVRTYE